MSVVDGIVLGLVVLFAIGGLRQGFVASVLSLAGLVGGALLGIQVGPRAARHGDGAHAQAAIAVVVVIVCAGVGLSAMSILGAALRRRLTSRPSRAVDSVLGALTSAFAVVIAGWLVAAPLASSSFPRIVAGVRDSEILRGVDRQLPGSARSVYDSMTELLDRNDFPDVLGGLTPTRVHDVPEADPSLVDDPTVTDVAPSIVKIVGDATSCSRRIEGSGFVIAPHRVITNAHVVAGVDGPHVRTVDATEHDATVVLYDSRRDVAVLDVPDLDADPLNFATSPASSGDDAIIAGYPGDGPFFVGAARIRGSERIDGPDIYDDTTVHREVYAIRADVRNGNSGGPLLGPDGAVYGLIFAAAADRADTGFALTAAEIAPDLRSAPDRVDEVDTGSCTS